MVAHCSKPSDPGDCILIADLAQRHTAARKQRPTKKVMSRYRCRPRSWWLQQVVRGHLALSETKPPHQPLLHGVLHRSLKSPTPPEHRFPQISPARSHFDCLHVHGGKDPACAHGWQQTQPAPHKPGCQNALKRSPTRSLVYTLWPFLLPTHSPCCPDGDAHRLCLHIPRYFHRGIFILYALFVPLFACGTRPGA